MRNPFIDDRSLIQPLVSRSCFLCKHLDRQTIVGKTHKCKAFPSGIPQKIWSGENSHTQPFPGDGGVIFEKADDADRVQIHGKPGGS